MKSASRFHRIARSLRPEGCKRAALHGRCTERSAQAPAVVLNYSRSCLKSPLAPALRRESSAPVAWISHKGSPGRPHLFPRRPPGLDGKFPGAGVAQPDDPPLNNLAFTCMNGAFEEVNGKDSSTPQIERFGTACWIRTRHASLREWILFI